MTYKVKVKNVSKVFDLNRNRFDKLLSLITFGYFYKPESFYALRDISFEVMPGDSVGIIGLNGSGKSTLSDLLGEATVPTMGNIDIKGRSSLIAISAGLETELNGEENIKRKCLMHGLSEKQINERYDDIVAFSELGEFIKQPIKSYSSGMKSRLGFAIAINTDPDVLIVDEALSVGDETFANKCIVKMKELQAQGKTIFFVSHSTGQISKLCNKVIWVHYGELLEYGPTAHIVKKYNRFIKKFKSVTKDKQLQYKDEMIEKQQEVEKVMLDNKNEASKRNLVAVLLLCIAFLYAGSLQLGLF